MKLTELLDRYALLMNLHTRSIALYAHTIAKFEEYLGRPAMMEDLNDVEVSKFMKWRAQNPCRGRVVSPHTVAKDRSQLLALWNWACRKKLHPGEWPGLPRIKKVRRTPTAFTIEEVSRLVLAARRRTRDVGDLPASWWWSTLLQTAWQTGERVGALLRLKWGEVDAQRRRIVFLAETRKGQQNDLVSAITPALAAELEVHRAAPDSLVWPWPGEPLSIYASMRLLCKAAQVPPRAFHAIRKASASYVAAGGGDATSHLGHADPAMTRGHYLDPRITELKSGLDFLPPLNLEEPGKPVA